MGFADEGHVRPGSRGVQPLLGRHVAPVRRDQRCQAKELGKALVEPAHPTLEVGDLVEQHPHRHRAVVVCISHLGLR